MISTGLCILLKLDQYRKMCHQRNRNRDRNSQVIYGDGSKSETQQYEEERTLL